MRLIIIFNVKSLVAAFCIALSSLCGGLESEYSHEFSPPSQSAQGATETFSNIDSYTLRRSFGFYDGSIDMALIESITFCKEAPEYFDESWNANITDSSELVGYLCGKDVYVVGETIYTNPDCGYMFAAYNSYGDELWSSLVSITGLDLLNTSLSEDMELMFAHCKFEELHGIGQWDVSRVRTFAGMFQGNSNSGDNPLKYVDVGKWNTSSAENMSHMFYGCSKMEYVPVEHWDVSNVKTFSHMFADCYALKSIDISNWDSSSAESFDAMFNDCRSLTSLDVGGLDTENCLQFSQMFESCTSLMRITGIETWDVSNASYYAFSEMFHCCYELEHLDIGRWTASPDNTARMFKNCYNLKRIDISGFDMSSNTADQEMFMNCKSLTEIVG